MALSAGKRTVNPWSGKPSYISLASDTAFFDNDSTVSVTDENGDPWSATPMYQNNPKILPIKLNGKQSGGAVAAAAMALAAGVPDTGQLTVTVTNSADPPVDIPVAYVDDPSP